MSGFEIGAETKTRSRAEEANRLRGIASVFQERLDGLTGDTPSSRAQIRSLRRQNDLLLLKADSVDPLNDPGEIERQSETYEVTSWKPLELKASEGRVMTDEEVTSWVDEMLINDPMLFDRLGFTDETTDQEMALTIILHQPNQPA